MHFRHWHCSLFVVEKAWRVGEEETHPLFLFVTISLMFKTSAPLQLSRREKWRVCISHSTYMYMFRSRKFGISELLCYKLVGLISNGHMHIIYVHIYVHTCIHDVRAQFTWFGFPFRLHALFLVSHVCWNTTIRTDRYLCLRDLICCFSVALVWFGGQRKM
jgi:hypothetical protein